MAKQKKSAKKADVKVGGSESQKQVANFLIKELGEKDAVKVAAGMEQAATAKGMKRRFGRLRAVVASASASAAA